jgi:hypothetical protein
MTLEGQFKHWQEKLNFGKKGLRNRRGKLNTGRTRDII